MENHYQAIKKFCHNRRIRYLSALSINTWLLIINIVFILGIVLSLIFSFFPWTVLPVVFDVSLILAALGCGLVLIYRWLITRPSLYDIAALLEQTVEKKHQLLKISLELRKKRVYGSSQLIDNVCREAKKSLPLYKKKLRNILIKRRLAFSLILFLLFLSTSYLIKPRLLAWWDIPIQFFSSVPVEIIPGKIAIPQNTSLVLQCIPAKALYPSATLVITEFSSFQSKNRSYLLRPDHNNHFSFALDSLTTSLAYSFTLGNKTWGPDTIKVIPPPLLYSLKVSLFPPPYTKKPRIDLPESQGSITAYKGTKATFSIQSLAPLKDAYFIFAHEDTSQLIIKDGKAYGEFQVNEAGSYTFYLEDTLEQKSDSLPYFFVNILPDYHPNVRIIKPGMNKIISSTQQETLWVEAVDDFAIEELTLLWKQNSNNSQAFSRNILPQGKSEKIIRRQLTWDLTTLSLYPGDTVFYWVRTRDNQPLKPFQMSSSDTFFFRLPSFAEIHKHIVGQEDDADQAITSVKKLQEEMKTKLESLIKSAKGKNSLSWEEKKIVEDLGKNIQEQTDSLNRAINSLKDAVDRMKESEIDHDIVDKMDEVRKAIKELVAEYGDSLLFKQPNPEEKLGWQDLKKAIEQMTEMLPDLQERLDNVLEYLKMLKQESIRAMLAEEAKKLAEEQLSIAQSGESKNDLAKQQRKLNQQIDDFNKKTQENLGNDPQSQVSMKDIPAMGKVNNLQQQMQSQLSQQQMPSSSTMNQMASALQEASQQLQATLSSNMAMKAMRDRERLLTMAQEVTHIAQWQQELAESMGEAADQKMAISEQQSLQEALQKSINRLDSLEIVPPLMLQNILTSAQKTLSNMKQSLFPMNNANPVPGMKSSIAGLNSLAGTILNSAKNMQMQGSGSGQGGGMAGMMGGLQKLSAKQAAINSATAEMLRQMMNGSGKNGNEPGNGTASGQDNENARKAAQNAQQQLADQLNHLAEKYGKDSEGNLTKRVKELEEEARRIAQMLQNPTPQVSERQDRFLVRMLQSTLSIHKQGKGKEERKSKSAIKIYSNLSPAKQDRIFDHTDTFYKLRMKAMDSNFPDSYRTTVQAYFDSLGVLFLKEN